MHCTNDNLGLLQKKSSEGQAPKTSPFSTTAGQKFLPHSSDSNAAVGQLIKTALQFDLQHEIPSYVLEHMRSSSTLTQAVSLPLQPASEALHTPIASAAVQQSLSLLKMATTVLVLPMQPYEQSPAVVQLGENGMTIAVNSNLLGSFLQCASSGSSRHPKPLNNQFTALMQPCDTGFSTAVNPNTFGGLQT